MKAIIHIGTTKTGSTTIQTFLRKNRRALKKRSIFTPTTRTGGGLHSHACLPAATYLFDEWEKRHPRFATGINTVAQQDRLRKKLCREIETNCRKDDTAIFSCEALCYFSHQEVEQVKKFLSPLFDDITIVLYLRRQPEWLISIYAQRVKKGNSHSFDNFLNEYPKDERLLDYRRLIENWSSIFGKDKIKVRVFDRKEFHNNDLLDDFAHTVGLEMTGLLRTEDTNTSFGSAETEFLRLLNKRGRRNLELSLAKMFLPRTGEKAYFLNRQEAQRILDQCREGNDWVAREYCGRDKLFSEDVSMYPEEVSPHHLTVERSAEIADQLLRFQRNVFFEVPKRYILQTVTNWPLVGPFCRWLTRHS